MREVILLIIAFVLIEVSAQTQRPANIEIPITVYDNSGLPESSRVLTCGIDSTATDSIDALLGEYWLFCPFAINGNNSDCTPYDHFEAVLDIPVEPDPLSFFFGSWKDFRYGMIPYSGIKTYTIYYMTYEVATALYLSWNFPDGVTGLLVDLNYPMPDSGTFTHPYFMSSNDVTIRLTYQNVIPVELISFNSALIDNKVQLNWTTATETNNKGFEIERARRSSSNYAEAGWVTIGFVPGFGTTTEPKSYSFVDEDVTTGIYKYRLKQIDFDGTFTFSNETEVAVDFTPKEFVLYQNYPNPFNPTTTIKYEIPGQARNDKVVVVLKVYDVLGNEVTTLVNEEKQPGVYEVEFNASDLSSCIYFYQLKSTDPETSSGRGFVDTKKMILLR
jgi:hypothetical protein